MFALLIVIHVLICLALIIAVLLQSAKGEGLAGAFGGGGVTSAVFGGRGAATFLSQATSYLAILFMLSSLGLTFVSPSGRGGDQESAVRKEAGKATESPAPVGVLPGDAGQGETGQGVRGLPPGVPPPPTGTTKPAAGNLNFGSKKPTTGDVKKIDLRKTKDGKLQGSATGGGGK